MCGHVKEQWYINGTRDKNGKNEMVIIIIIIILCVFCLFLFLFLFLLSLPVLLLLLLYNVTFSCIHVAIFMIKTLCKNVIFCTGTGIVFSSLDMPPCLYTNDDLLDRNIFKHCMTDQNLGLW